MKPTPQRQQPLPETIRRFGDTRMTIRTLTLLLSILHLSIVAAQAAIVGINYGRVANNLPRPTEVARLVKSSLPGVTHVKIFDSDRPTIRAFDGDGLSLIVGVPNEELPSLAATPKAALTWIHNHIVKRVPAAHITHLLVGNEILSSLASIWPSLVPAMSNLHSALVHYGLDHQIQVSTPHSMGILAASYPPSAGIFREDIRLPIMKKLLEFLRATQSTFMMNIYPYFPLRDDPVNVPLAYALFLDTPGVTDPTTGLHYGNLFDAMLDASVFAMRELGFDDVPVMVTETGWPSQGDPSEAGVATVANAGTYNRNVVKHVRSNQGTPARPGKPISTCIFAMFNENEKPGSASERNFGLFYPNKTRVYEISIT